MEHKIGEILTLPDGRKVEVVETKHDSCEDCMFNKTEDTLDCLYFEEVDYDTSSV